MKKNIQQFMPFIIATWVVIGYTIGHQLRTKHNSGMIAMNDVMGIRFGLFGVLKLLDLKWYVRDFCRYDIVAKKRKGYAYLFPFLEIMLWVAYIRDSNMHYWIGINVATLCITGITWIGIYISLQKKEKIDCVCMGTIFPLPMSKINFIENIAMGAMAVGMIIRMSIWTHIPGAIIQTDTKNTTGSQEICHQ
jgi:hypothetical protein